jgi:tetratricopeptide (TPR) repeat protein
VSFEVQLDRRALECSPISSRADSLPLSAATKKLLQAADAHLTVAELLRSLSILPQTVCRQLGALKVLGLINLVPLAEPSPSAKTGTRSTATRATAPERKRPQPTPVEKEEPSPEDILQRLEGEYNRLKNADDFTILGVPKGADDDQVRTASKRMCDRYGELSKDKTLPDPLRSRATILTRLTKQAEKRILTSREMSEALDDATTPAQRVPADQSTEELAYSEGVKAFSAGNYKRAVQCFKKARDERIDSARNMAWLGWALFHQKELPEAERNEEAMDLLWLASTFDPTHRQAQFFLAFVEFKTGEAKKAETRLNVLLKTHTDHKEAKRLLQMVLSKKK